MQIDDLRDYLDILEEYGEVQRIGLEVDWNLEMGAITRRVYDLGAAAALFENVKGYPKGFRALGAPLGTSKHPGHGLFARTALAMHMPPGSSAHEIMATYLKRKEKLIPPTVVKTGPCKENIDIGDAVDVLKFPIPLIHGGDGGRYVGTWHTVITKDPDSSWVNWGMYRLMVHDRNTLPPYVNEVEVAGALQGAPIPLVKCETVDLEVPASAEIVIEGEVLPHERMVEGPFGEYMGYEAGKSSPKPILKIKAITYRNNPILPFSNMGMPVHEGQTATALIKGAEIYSELKKLGLPIKGVFCPPFGVGHMCVVSTEVPFVNFARRVAHAVWATKPGLFTYFIVIVEADVDPTNMDQVLHAITTKCHPVNGIHPVPHIPGFPVLLPFLPPKERLIGDAAGVIFDCTWPKDWPQESIPVKASFENLWPADVQDRVLKNWEAYGYAKLGSKAGR
jgi:3-polyprenyl-4-hydroxybenzoate decarboxylase